MPKIRITAKKPSNESCSALNFVQKCPRGHMSICPQSGARRLKQFIKRNYPLYTMHIQLIFHVFTHNSHAAHMVYSRFENHHEQTVFYNLTVLLSKFGGCYE